MTGQDKEEEEEDALIDILKTVVEECKPVYKKTQIRTPSSETSKIQGASFVAEDEEGDSSETLPYQQPSNEINPGSLTFPCTIGNLNIYAMADIGAGINMMPKSLNKLIKADKFLFHSDFVVIDTLEGPNETILLGFLLKKFTWQALFRKANISILMKWKMMIPLHWNKEVGVVLNDEQQDFLADSLEETDDCEDLQLQAASNFKADHVDAYDSDCDDEATANAIFMANLSLVGSLNDDTVEPYYDFDILSESYDELTSNNNVISYTDYMLTIGNDDDHVQKNDMMLSVIEQMKSQVGKCNMVNQEKQSENGSLTSELEQYKDRVRVLEYAVKDGHSG
ncbi:hypothetical protein Tco_1142913 [Tanacetum coccineum]